MSGAILGFTLDAGALIQIERGDARTRRYLDQAERRGWPIVVPAGVLAQVWRGDSRQARLGLFLHARRTGEAPGRRVSVVALDELTARRAGELCGQSRGSDVVDASVALCAADRGHAVLTSDPGDLARLDPELPLIRV